MFEGSGIVRENNCWYAFPIIERLKANKKAVTESSPVTSKCTACVDAQVCKQMYALFSRPSLLQTYKGPAKSTSTLLN